VSNFGYDQSAQLGPADFPSMPWIAPNTMTVSNGRVTGAGSALVSQGVTFPYAGTRLRFTGKFTDSAERVTVAMNAKLDGSGGLAIAMEGGKVTLTENGTARGSTEFAPLGTSDWFVEAILGASTADVVISTGNYGASPGASLIGSLDISTLDGTALGGKLALSMTGSGSVYPQVDGVYISRCGVPAPTYQPLFSDSFNRPNSTSLGNAEIPSTSAWSLVPNEGTSVSIAGNTLEFTGSTTVTAPQAAAVDNRGIRVRLVFAPISSLNMNGFLAAYNFNLSPLSEVVFGVLYNSATSTYVGSNYYDFGLVLDTKYFVEFDVDDPDAVLTVRSGSYDGPLIAMDTQAATGALSASGTNVEIRGTSLQMDEFRIDRYAAP
jgi:hypothetical protein